MAPEGVDEPDWIDAVNANLARGRMTLVIAGDGIRSAVEMLADAVGRHPDFLFRLALLELRVYRRPADGLRIVIPSVLARTAEIERAVVRIEYVPTAAPRVSVETPTVDVTTPRWRAALSEEALREELRRQPEGDVAASVVDKLLDLIAPPLEVQWRSAGFAVHMSEPGVEDGTLPLCVVTERLVLYGYLPWLQRRLERGWQDPKAIALVVDAYTRLWMKYGAKPTRTRQYNLPLPAMAGRESEFVADLKALAELIQQHAPAGSSG